MNTSPPTHPFAVSYICVALFSNTSEPTDRKHLCVNVLHRCKAWLCFLSFFITNCKRSEKPHVSVSLPSYFHRHHHLSSAVEGHGEGFRMELVVLTNRPSRSSLSLSRTRRPPRRAAIHHCAPFAQNGAAALWWPWPVTHCILCVTSQPVARLCSCPAPHHRADAWRKTTETLWRSSKWHESWLLFTLLRCSSCCVYPWGWFSVTIPIFPNRSLPVCFSGHGSPQSVTQFCVCRWALSGVAVMMRVDQF